MKQTYTILIIIMLIMIGCQQKQTDNNDFITVDVTKNYSLKKELILQDFMDVEYIAIETNDNFVNQGLVRDIGEKLILVTNRNDDGNIFVYDRNGKALRKINHKGQGYEEYIDISGIRLDEDNGEMFVNDIISRKILVYDLYGKYKRSFKPQKGSESKHYTAMFNYDRDNLICYDKYNEEIAFVLISKQDGSITKEIKIPIKDKKLLYQMRDYHVVTPGFYPSLIPHRGDWILVEHSSDTVYTISPDYNLHPLLVRTPPIRSMDPEVFLILRLLSDRYYFMETVRNVYDFNKGSGFPKKYMMYDKQEKSFSGYTVYNGDFSTKKEVYMSVAIPVNHYIHSLYLLEAFDLVESYNKGELKGKLKEIAATLNEESNPVIMLIKHKK